MLKKFICKSIVFITLFSFWNVIYAYDYYDAENEDNVNDMINEIYDAKQQYIDLAGGEEEELNFVKSSSNLFWWPIGSKETTTIDDVLFATGDPQTIVISSYFGGFDGFRVTRHGGLDISNAGYGIGVVNIIAAKDGVVIYPNSRSEVQFEDKGYYGNKEGFGYGNYVKIQHSDGTYTVYGHLAKDSVTVFAGETVQQGQVIAKMGNSGSSTGAHLHFEVRVGANTTDARVDPLLYIDPKNPRPMSFGNSDGFSTTTTSLTRSEFVAKMQNYYERTGHKSFGKNFLPIAGEIYDVALENNVNPELVVVTAGTEQGWHLTPSCEYTHNYWGIGITNGKGCNSGAKYSSILEGVAGYGKLLSTYTEFGSKGSAIIARYNERSSAGCDTSGHGLPGTVVGMQSIYSWVGNYRYNPGSWGLGGCVYFNIIYGENYCSLKSTCTNYSSCPSDSKTTVCEQNDYTAFQVKDKMKMRYDIFGI